MITVKLIPNLLSKEGRLKKQFPFTRKHNIKDYLDQSEFDYIGKRIIVSGKRIDNINRFIDNDDEILILPDVALDPATWAALSFWGKLLFVTKTVLTIATIGYSIYAAMQRPRIPSFSAGADESSPTYGWDGVVTTQDIGIPVPIIYGEHKVGGNIINAFISTDGDKNYLNVLLALGEGEIEDIDDIEINDNPIANFDGITTYEKTGTNTQTVIANFGDLHNLYAVNTELTKNNAYVYTTTNTDVEAFKIHFELPNGLYEIDSSSGNLKAWSVTYRVQYRVSGVGAYTDLGETTIDYKSRTVMRRYYEKTGLTAAKYDIRITKMSDDSTDYLIGDLWVQSIDEIQTDDLTYPNTALLGFKALASEQLSGGMPKFTCVVKGRKISVPKIMNGGDQVDWEDYYWNTDDEEYQLLSDNTSLTWDGSTYVDQYCGNPIWCMKDLLLNSRYGLGEFIDTTHIDDTLFLEMSRYCEEKVPNGAGEYEKRFILDVVIDSASKALDWIMQLCATFRGMPFYSENTIKLRIDKPEDPTQLFTMGNIVKDSFIQNWKSIKDVPNVMEIQFMDRDKSYKQDQIAYIDEDALAAGDPMRKKGIRLFTTRMSQTIREARYALKVAKYINRTISFKAGIDAIAMQPGDIISVSHDVPQWGYSGRIKNALLKTQITLDREMTIEDGTTYKLQIRFWDDVIEERTVTNSAGTTNIITVSQGFSRLAEQYDIYVFGPSTAVKKDFRVVSLEKSGKNEAEITAAEYDETVYDDSEIDLPSNNYSDLSLAIPIVESLNLTERMVKLKDGTIETVIDVWWEKPTRDNFVQTLRNFRVYLSDNGGDSWALSGETVSDNFSIVGGIEDLIEYKVCVTTVNGFGEETAIANSAQAIITPIGKSASPSDVSAFLVNQSRDRIYFGWTEITDVDLFGYEIRLGADWDSGQVVVTGIKTDHYITIDFRTGSGQSYWIKAIDTSGNYSENALEATVTVDNIPFQNIVVTYSEQVDWTGTKVNTEKSGNNLIISAGQLSGTYTTAIRDVGYVATFRISIETVTAISQGRAFDDDATTRFNTSATERFTGQEQPGAATFEIRVSEDNITWGSWATWQAGDYKCRYFQLRMTLTRENVGDSLNCSTFDYYADLPDIDEWGEERITNAGAAAGKAVVFTKTFHENPTVNISILTGGGIYYRFSVSPTTTGFTVVLFDINANARGGTFRYHAHGI